MARKPRKQELPPYMEAPDFVTTDLEVKVAGFKAIREEISLRIAPLTIISGINSAGKSSFMQPLLLMKQTLDAGFDPGALLLHGSNAKFTDRSQTLNRGKATGSRLHAFSVDLRAGQYERKVVYADSPEGYVIESDSFANGRVSMTLAPDMGQRSLASVQDKLSHFGAFVLNQYQNDEDPASTSDIFSIGVSRDRCFLEGVVTTQAKNGFTLPPLGVDVFDSFTDAWAKMVRDIIHVPGLRGNPEREYPRAAAGSSFPGTFDQYVASVILQWGEKNDPRLQELSRQMHVLGLTWKIFARRKNDATVEVLVGRMSHPQQGGAMDLVSIADVGFGVSQTLPVVVGLLAARPGQIVYIEQPEIHLHPRAQVELGEVLVQAAKRGVKVIAETHSSLLIRAIQTQVAKGTIAPHEISLNWFGRDQLSGNTTVEAADVDAQGRFGAWPLDFDDVAEEADMAYIKALGNMPAR
jgi:hypothetical protein